MKAEDVMTRDIVSIEPNATVKRAASVMAGKRISGLPVLSQDGAVIGIVSESDLLHRVELGTAAEPKQLMAYFSDPEAMARDFSKAHGSKVHDVMSRPVISVESDAELIDVADTFDRYKIKRVAVLKNGKLAGMITRSDLVRALSRSGGANRDLASIGSDATLYKTIRDRTKQLPWIDSSYINITVSGGLARLSGFVSSKDQQSALRVLIEEIPGIAGIEDTLKIGLPELGWDGLH